MSKEGTIELPFWRKKVDKSLLFDRIKTILIPLNTHKQWELEELIGEVNHQSDERSHITLEFRDGVINDYKKQFGEVLPAQFPGRITYFFPKGRAQPGYRLFLKPREDNNRTVVEYLRPLYSMSFFRELDWEFETEVLEKELIDEMYKNRKKALRGEGWQKDELDLLEDWIYKRKMPEEIKIQNECEEFDKEKKAELTKRKTEAKKEKPELFHEFLDMEWEKDTKTIFLTPRYTINPTFPHVFKQILTTPSIKKKIDTLEGKTNIYPQEWRTKDQMNQELPEKNLIYILINTKSKKFYVGETGQTFGQRLQDPGYKKKMGNWDYYKIIALPDSIEKKGRKTIEKAMIHAFASVLEEGKKPEKVMDIDKITKADFSDYKLMNLDIKR